MDMAITLSHNEQDVQVDELSRKLLWLRHLAEIFTLDIMFIVQRARGAGHSSPWPQGGGGWPHRRRREERDGSTRTNFFSKSAIKP